MRKEFLVRDFSKNSPPALNEGNRSKLNNLRDLFTLLAYTLKDRVFKPDTETSDKRLLNAVDNDLTFTARHVSRRASLPDSKKNVFRIAAKQLISVKQDPEPDIRAERAARNALQEITDIVRVKYGVPTVRPKQGA